MTGRWAKVVVAVGAVLAMVAVELSAGAGPRVVAPAGAAPVSVASGPPGDPHIYRPPLDAVITDPFRGPPQPWAPGNRGLEYATAAGQSVGAIGPGVVVFAGPVAGALYVTVRHPDGLRSSYSYLAAIGVSVGDSVTTGQVVGVAGSMMHLGVRDGDTYIDPASLFGTSVGGGSVYLVPAGGGSAAPGRPRGGPMQTGPLASTGEWSMEATQNLIEAVAAAAAAAGDKEREGVH